MKGFLLNFLWAGRQKLSVMTLTINNLKEEIVIALVCFNIDIDLNLVVTAYSIGQHNLFSPKTIGST